MEPQHQSNWHTYKRLLTYVKPFWLAFILAIVGNLGFAGIEATMIAALKPFLDQGVIAKDKTILNNLPFYLVGLVTIRGIASFIATYYMSYVGRKVVLTLRQLLFEHLLFLPNRFYDDNSSGQLLSKITYNTAQVASAATEALKAVVKEGATVVFLLGVMFYHSWQLTTVTLLIGPVIFVCVRYVSKRFHKLSKKIQNSMGGITHVAEEALEGVKVIKIFGGQKHESGKFAHVLDKNFNQEMKMTATKAITSPVIQFFVVCSLAAVIYLATRSSIEATFTAGTIVSMVAAMMAILRPIKRLTDVNPTIQRGIAAAESIFEILDKEPEQNSGSLQFKAIEQNILFENVSFAYDTKKGGVLHNINIDIKAGQTIALVGRSGSGKSTLANLLPRFYDQYMGRILVDGTDIREFKLDSLRSNISLVAQGVTLFNASIAENIAYGRLEGASQEAIKAAAESAHIMEFVDKLPNGLETLVGENGVMLSGGQRQRIAIARALLKNAPILILDEATSALDTESEKLIQQALNELIKNRTTLVIAHRLSTIESADKILVMDNGRIIEEGTHKELLQQDQHYAKLYHMQYNDGAIPQQQVNE